MNRSVKLAGLLIALAAISTVGPAEAANICWIQPITNFDGSPLLDAGTFQINIYPKENQITGTFRFNDIVWEVDPPLGRQCFPFDFQTIPVGRWGIQVAALDLIGNSSGLQNAEIEYVNVIAVDTTPPTAPQGLEVTN